MYTITMKQISGNTGIYWATENSSSRKLDLIAKFFSEIGFLAEYVKQCIEEENGFDYKSVTIDYVENNIVLSYIDEEDETWPRFTMTKEKFFSILDRWHEVYLTLPPYIEVSIDEHDNITINPAQEAKP